MPSTTQETPNKLKDDAPATPDSSSSGVSLCEDNPDPAIAAAALPDALQDQAHALPLDQYEAAMLIGDNNNVDLNSNDHHYHEYASYHEQYQHLPLINQPPVESVRPQRDVPVGLQLHQLSPPTDTPDLNTSSQLTVRSVVSQHRRNKSADVYSSSQLTCLPPLPPPTNISWLPRLPCPQEPPEVTHNQAGHLLYNFTREEFERNNISPPDHLAIYSGLSNPAWVSTGRSLRQLADAFSQSNERQMLRHRAERVQMSSVTMENFFELCKELFQGDGGITQERIVILFTFIGDVAINNVRQHANRFIATLMNWSLKFIIQHICKWVHEAGGWGVVLQQGASWIYNFAFFTMTTLTIIALGIYIKKGWKEL